MILARLDWAVGKLTGLSTLFGGLALLAALGVVVVDVTGRALGHPLYGARDIVQMAGIFVVFGGMAICHRKGGHISVDLMENLFSPLMNRILLILADLLSAAIFLLIAWQVWEAAKLADMLSMSTNLLYLPRAPFLHAMLAFSVVTALSMLLKALRLSLAAERAQ